MNEWILFFHIAVLLVLSLLALKIGREALVAFLSLQPILSNLFASKQIDLFHLTTTTCDPFIISCTLCATLLHEYFGAQTAKKALYISYALLLFFMLASQIQLLYIPSQYDTHHALFVPLLSLFPRLTLASFVVSFLAQRLHLVILSYFQRIWPGLPFSMRTFMAVTLSQLFDTVAFTYAAFYGNVHSVWHIIIICSFLKTIMILLNTPLTLFAKRIVKIHEV